MAKTKEGSETIFMELTRVCGIHYAYHILWLYCPEYFDEELKTFDDLVNKYQEMKGKKESVMKKGIYRDNVQDGIKILLKRIDKIRDSRLMDKYYKLAMGGDVQALKAYMDFKKHYFENADESELSKILGKVNLNSVDDVDDDFQMII